MNKKSGVFISLLMISVIFNILLPVVSKKSYSEPSKLEVLQFLLSNKDRFNIISKIRGKPFLQLIGLVNDIVEPIVTFAEAIQLIEQKMQKLETNQLKHHKHPEIDNVMVFSGKNKIEINHHQKPHHSDEHFYQLPTNIPLPDMNNLKEYESLIPMESNQLIKGDPIRERPELLSAGVRHNHGLHNENIFKLNFKSHHPKQKFNLVRDLPNNFALIFGKIRKKGSFHVLNDGKHQ